MTFLNLKLLILLLYNKKQSPEGGNETRLCQFPRGQVIECSHYLILRGTYLYLPVQRK